MVLNSEHQMIRDALREFSQERLAPNAARWDKEHHFPQEELTQLAELGAFGVAVPEKWGGAGLNIDATRIRHNEKLKITNRKKRKGDVFTLKVILIVGSSIWIVGNATGCSMSVMVSPIETSGIPAIATISPASADSTYALPRPSKSITEVS